MHLTINDVISSSWYIYILSDFTPLIKSLKSYSMCTNADGGIKSYSL